MKKLLTLFLVLSLTSWASASLVISISTAANPTTGDYSVAGSTYDLDVSSRIWIGIYNTTQGSSEAGTMQFTGFLRFADTTIAEWYTGASPSSLVYKPPAVADAPGNTYYGVNYGYDWWYTNMSDGTPTHFTGVGTVTGFAFKCLGLGDVDVELVDDDMSTILDTITISQVPEPMTIALLGLGGLFLRRRK